MGIKLADDTVDASDRQALADWILTNPRLTKGDLTIEFEKAFAKYVGNEYAVFVNSGSSANMLMFYSLIINDKIHFGDKVVVPAISWATDYAPVVQCGLNPILCDCNLDDLSVDINHLELLFKTEKPKVLILVSVLGMRPKMEAIKELCDKYRVILLEDNCESLGTPNLNHFGLMCSHSTFYGHHISTIEGGFVTTDSKSWYNVLCMLRAHGWIRDLDEQSKGYFRQYMNVNEFEEKYTFLIPGFNFRNTEIGAFLGLRQLKKADNFLRTRLMNAVRFYKQIENGWISSYLPSFALPLICESTEHRDKLVAGLKAKEIECRPIIAGNMAKQPMYSRYLLPGYQHTDLPNADIVHSRGLYLPNHQGLTYTDIDLMVEEVLKYEY